MKKIIFLTLIILLVYLNRSYAHIYNSIKSGHLDNPNSEKKIMVSVTDKTEKIKIVFLGDSLTAGVGVNDPENTYPKLVAKKLSEKYQVEVLNLGVPGATSNDVLLDQVVSAKEFKADKVVLFIGTNDLHNQVGPKDLKNNLQKIILNLDIDKDKLYIVNIPFMGTKKLFLPPFRNYFLLQTARYNKIFTELKDDGYKIIDLYGETVESFKSRDDIYAVDNFHPNDLGYQIFADIIYKNLL